jgi:hypothetical protein
VIALSLCAGCSFSRAATVAAEAVRKYHDQYNAGQYRDIYQQSDEAFKKGVEEQANTELLSAVEHKLGKVSEAKQVGFNANWSPEGTFVNLTYESTFERGKAYEQFVWRTSGDGAKLVSYNINSPALITK